MSKRDHRVTIRQTLWDAVKNDLPTLLTTAEAMLRDLDVEAVANTRTRGK